jgi:hypothetical protein
MTLAVEQEGVIGPPFNSNSSRGGPLRFWIYRRTEAAAVSAIASGSQHKTMSNYLGAPGNPRMAVLPFFHEFSEHQPPHLNNDAGFIFGKPTEFGVPDPIPIFPYPPHYPYFVSASHHDGSMAMFNAADWPAAEEDIVNMMRDVLSRMMQHIEQANTMKSQGKERA